MESDTLRMRYSKFFIFHLVVVHRASTDHPEAPDWGEGAHGGKRAPSQGERAPYDIGARRHGQGGGGQVHLPGNVVVFVCISSYSKTLSRPIIYALFSQYFSSDRGFTPGPKFTDDLRTILRQFSDLRQSMTTGEFTEHLRQS